MNRSARLGPRPSMASRYQAFEVLQAAKDLVRRANISGPPVNVELLARLQGVHEIIFEPLDGPEAELAPDGNGYVIRVDPRSNPARRRFSIAHEVAHTFFPHNHKSFRARAVTVPNGVGRRLGYRVEEALCDRAAAEMLMPEEIFLPMLRWPAPSVQLIKQAARTFETSIEATARRYASVVRPAAQLNMWRRRGDQLVAIWSWSQGGSVIRTEAVAIDAPEGTIEEMIVASYVSSASKVGWATDRRRRVLVDVAAFGRGDSRYVLSVLQSATRGLHW